MDACHIDHSIWLLRWLLSGALIFTGLSANAADTYILWQASEFAIAQPLGGLRGNPVRGRELVRQRDKGNCLACHRMPIEEESFHGTIGPSLEGIASRLSVAQLRLRVVNQQTLNPYTVMPSFYKDPQEVNRIGEDYIGMTVLSAQEVEDVVAYLATLKQRVSP
jgi:sulfur-oxidizing protein SoxX